ncbi:hypothetical protein [Syntrophomonas curvata]
MLRNTQSASAATSSEADYSQLSEQISSETIITEDNIYAVLEYVGLESSAFIRTDELKSKILTKTDKSNSNVVTVGDLEKEIEKFNLRPHTIIDTEDVFIKDVNANKSYPVKTVHSDSNYGSYTMRYFATGAYFVEPPPPHYTYWVQALGGDIQVASTDFPTVVTIKNISTLTNTLYNGGSPGSYLQLSFNYTVEIFIGVGQYGLIKIGENNISGFKNFYI